MKILAFLRKNSVKLVFALVILPATIASTLFYLNKRGFFDVADVEIVTAEEKVAQKEFLQPLIVELKDQLATYKNQSMWKINLSKVAKNLEQIKWIERASVQRRWPNSLIVTVEPYEVKLLFMGKNGKLLPVTEGGEFLDPIETKQAPDVALLEGEVFVKKPELRKKAVDVLQELPHEGSFSQKTISEVRYDSKEGFWMTLIKSGIQVKMGEDKIGLKAARVSKVVDYLDSREFDARVIDANLSKKVLVRLRKAP